LSSTNNRAPGARRFKGATGREALRLARESLGSDAMVLASRACEDGIEVIAMADDDNAVLVKAAEPMPALRSRPDAGTAVLPAETVLSELNSMRSMIESVVWSEQLRRDPLRARLLRTMLTAGFSALLSKALLEKLPSDLNYSQGLAFVRAELTRALLVQENEDALLAEGGAFALVGPTGVGKTTTTAKLAARCVMRFGADKLALVTTDGYRIGAYEQLRIYGQLLGVSVHAIKDAVNLKVVLRELQDKHLVLIDTVGMSQRDQAVSDQVAMLCSAGRPVKRLLLLNAASHGDTLNEVVYAYQNPEKGNQLAGCIFTKLDEAASYGALLDTAIRHRLPVHYLSNGQEVPENLATASGAQLVEDALRAPAPGALFACNPDIAASSGGAGDEVARAHAQTDRIRQQYQQLIRAMAHDAEEIAVAAKFLEQADVGFSLARDLWRSVVHEHAEQHVPPQRLLINARAELLKACDTHVLAVCGNVRVDPSEGGGPALELPTGVLLSDRDGRPFGVPDQFAAAGDQGKPQGLGLPFVHFLARMPNPEQAAEYAEQGQAWLARAGGSTLVADPASGGTIPLWRINTEFGPEKAIDFRGKAALREEGESRIKVPRANGTELTLRCVRRRTLDAQSRRPLEQWFLWSNVAQEITSHQLLQWQEWAARGEACLRLASKGVALLGGVGETRTSDTMQRLSIAGHMATCAWRVLQIPGVRAERTRVLLTELAGRQVRPDRPQSGTALYEGLAKLFQLLEALALGSGT